MEEINEVVDTLLPTISNLYLPYLFEDGIPKAIELLDNPNKIE